MKKWSKSHKNWFSCRKKWFYRLRKPVHTKSNSFCFFSIISMITSYKNYVELNFCTSLNFSTKKIRNFFFEQLILSQITWSQVISLYSDGKLNFEQFGRKKGPKMFHHFLWEWDFVKIVWTISWLSDSFWDYSSCTRMRFYLFMLVH